MTIQCGQSPLNAMHRSESEHTYVALLSPARIQLMIGVAPAAVPSQTMASMTTGRLRYWVIVLFLP